jgi:hypothetical protein
MVSVHSNGTTGATTTTTPTGKCRTRIRCSRQSDYRSRIVVFGTVSATINPSRGTANRAAAGAGFVDSKRLLTRLRLAKIRHRKSSLIE